VPSWVFPAGATSVVLPARFLSRGDIIVRMNVNGRGLDLSLDTGTSYDALDSSVFSSMRLPAPTAVFDSISFGPAQMHALPFVEGSFYRHAEDGSLIVGLLGYDFLKEAVVEIDYDHQRLRVIQPSAFRAPPGSMEYPIYSDETVPLVSAAIGHAMGGSFVIDTGATTVVVFPRFVVNNKSSFTAAQVQVANQEVQSFRFFWPLCGHIEMIPYSVPQMKVETVGVHDWVVWAVPSGSCFALKRLDGLIGFDFLRLFNVYIDYPQNQVILEPNAVYKNAPNSIKL
jgi:predicted aspartyl protease